MTLTNDTLSLTLIAILAGAAGAALLELASRAAKRLRRRREAAEMASERVEAMLASLYYRRGAYVVVRPRGAFWFLVVEEVGGFRYLAAEFATLSSARYFVDAVARLEAKEAKR